MERFDEQQAQDQVQKERIESEKELAERVHQETLEQLEADADEEIEKLKVGYEDQLGEEREDKVRVSSDFGHLRAYERDSTLVA